MTNIDLSCAGNAFELASRISKQLHKAGQHAQAAHFEMRLHGAKTYAEALALILEYRSLLPDPET